MGGVFSDVNRKGPKLSVPEPPAIRLVWGVLEVGSAAIGLAAVEDSPLRGGGGGGRGRGGTYQETGES